MSELKPYQVEVNGAETTLMLSDEEAKERGLKSADAKAVEPAANKSRSAANK